MPQPSSAPSGDNAPMRSAPAQMSSHRKGSLQHELDAAKQLQSADRTTAREAPSRPSSWVINGDDAVAAKLEGPLGEAELREAIEVL